MTVMSLDLKHLGASLRKDQIVISGGLRSQDDVANDRVTGGLIDHLAVMFSGVGGRGSPGYAVTGGELQSETKERHITGHLLTLRILERFRMLLPVRRA